MAYLRMLGISMVITSEMRAISLVFTSEMRAISLVITSENARHFHVTQ